MKNWRAYAACAEMDGDLFFPEYMDPNTHTNEAKRVCQTCPVQIHCLRYALDNNIGEGIWGGLTPGARKRLRVVA
jgi:WhiB family redox-sensing transcriptional regulator